MERTTANLSVFLANLLCLCMLTAYLTDRVWGLSGTLTRVCLGLVALLSVLFYFTSTHLVAVEVFDVLWRGPNTNIAAPSSAGEQHEHIGRFSAQGIRITSNLVAQIAHTNFPQVMIIIISLYIVLQTFCIPGTILLNTVCGALLGVVWGVPLCVVLGTAGAMSCYMLSSLVGTRLVERVDARLMKSKGLPAIRAQVQRFRSDLFVYLLFLRLTPVLPNWLINLSAPVLHVPIVTFALATFIGIFPQTYLAVRFGTFVTGSTVLDSADQQQQHHTPKNIVDASDTFLLCVLAAAIVIGSKLKKRFTVTTSGSGSSSSSSSGGSVHHPASISSVSTASSTVGPAATSSVPSLPHLHAVSSSSGAVKHQHLHHPTSGSSTTTAGAKEHHSQHHSSRSAKNISPDMAQMI